MEGERERRFVWVCFEGGVVAGLWGGVGWFGVWGGFVGGRFCGVWFLLVCFFSYTLPYEDSLPFVSFASSDPRSENL